MTENLERPAHVLDLHGEGHFSKGSCTGCSWASSGSADDVSRRWDQYHPDGGVHVLELPKRVEVPPPHEDLTVQLFEHRIIVLLTHYVDFKRDSALLVAAGVAQARELATGGNDDKAREYVSVLMGRIAHLSRRQREKLRHPSRNREEQQRILDGDVL